MQQSHEINQGTRVNFVFFANWVNRRHDGFNRDNQRSWLLTCHFSVLISDKQVLRKIWRVEILAATGTQLPRQLPRPPSSWLVRRNTISKPKYCESRFFTNFPRTALRASVQWRHAHPRKFEVMQQRKKNRKWWQNRTRQESESLGKITTNKKTGWGRNPKV